MIFPRPLVIVLCAIPWMIAGFGVLWLFSQRFPPSGTFVATTNLDGKSAWIQQFLPGQRTSIPGKQADGWIGQRISGDPVYFTARSPGPYDKVDVEIEFRPIHQPLLEFGMVRDAAGKELEMRPFFSEELASSRFRTVEGLGFVALGTPNARLQDPRPEGLAIWGASTTMPQLADTKGEWRDTAVALRGSHEFSLVPIDGEIHMRFVLQAANRSQGGDIAAFRIFRGDEEVGREAVSISGSRDQKLGSKVTHDVHLPNARTGIYRIQFIAQDDVFIRSIGTNSRRWVLGPRLVSGDEVGYSTSTPSVDVWTNSRHIVAETFHVEGLQEITLGPVKTTLRHTHQPSRLDRPTDPEKLARLHAPRGDIRFIGDGYFAFSQEAFFEPRPRRLTDGTVAEAEKIEAVLTPYQRPMPLGEGWLKGTSSYELRPGQDQLRFVLSAPGMESRAGAVDVRRVTLQYHRTVSSFSGWLGIVRRELANAWRRL